MFIKGQVTIVVKNKRSLRFNITNNTTAYLYIIGAYKLTKFDTEAKSRFPQNLRSRYVSIVRNDGQYVHLPVPELIQHLCGIPVDKASEDVCIELCRAAYDITRDLD